MSSKRSGVFSLRRLWFQDDFWEHSPLQIYHDKKKIEKQTLQTDQNNKLHEFSHEFPDFPSFPNDFPGFRGETRARRGACLEEAQEWGRKSWELTRNLVVELGLEWREREREIYIYTKYNHNQSYTYIYFIYK